MRLTKKREDGLYDNSSGVCDEEACKLGKLEDIEQELDIGLVSLFDSKYTGNMFEIEIEDDKTIFFDGDSFYGHYSAEQFLQLIKDMLSMYKQLIKPKRN